MHSAYDEKTLDLTSLMRGKNDNVVQDISGNINIFDAKVLAITVYTALFWLSQLRPVYAIRFLELIIILAYEYEC